MTVKNDCISNLDLRSGGRFSFKRSFLTFHYKWTTKKTQLRPWELFYVFVRIQPWCSTMVDDDGKDITGNWGYCGPDSPTEEDGWLNDESLSMKPQYSGDNK